MKLCLKVMLFCAFISAIGFAPLLRAAPGCTCTLVWNASPSPDIAGYAVYYGVSGGSVTNRYDAGLALTATITGLLPATTYFFYVVSYDAYDDESPPSNELLFTTPAISPVRIGPSGSGTVNIQFTAVPGAVCSVEYSPSLNPPAWSILTTTLADSNGIVSVYDTANPSQPSGFYRGMVGSELAPQLSAATGLTTTLQWDSSSNPSTIGWEIYYGVVGSSVTNLLHAGLETTTATVSLDPSTSYFFYVVSYDVFGESPPSNVIQFTTPSQPPPISPLQISQLGVSMVMLKFTVSPGAACHIEYTTNLNSPAWILLGNTVADTNGLVQVPDNIESSGTRFYRASVP